MFLVTNKNNCNHPILTVVTWVYYKIKIRNVMPKEVMLFLLGTVFTIGFIFYMYFTTRNRERMAIIEKGGDISYPTSKDNKHSALKWGIIFLSLGISLAIGLTLDIWNDSDGPIYTMPTILTGVGLGMLTYYKKKAKDEEEL